MDVAKNNFIHFNARNGIADGLNYNREFFTEIFYVNGISDFIFFFIREIMKKQFEIPVCPSGENVYPW